MIKKIIIVILFIVATIVRVQTDEVKLIWDPMCNTNIHSYVIHYGTNSSIVPVTKISPSRIDSCGIQRPSETNIFKGVYTFIHIVNGYTNTSTIITNLVKGVKYYFTVTCRNAIGIESSESAEIEYIVPPNSTNSIPSKVVGFKIVEIK